MVDLILLATIIVAIVDVSGFTDSWKSGLKRLLTKGRMSDPNYSMKPFDCSLCITFWLGLVYLIAVGELSLLTMTALLVISLMTPVFADVLFLVRDSLRMVIYKLRKLFKV